MLKNRGQQAAASPIRFSMMQYVQSVRSNSWER